MSYKHLCPEERHYIEIELKWGLLRINLQILWGEAKAAYRASLAKTQLKEAIGKSKPRVLPKNGKNKSNEVKIIAPMVYIATVFSKGNGTC